MGVYYRALVTPALCNMKAGYQGEATSASFIDDAEFFGANPLQAVLTDLYIRFQRWFGYQANHTLGRVFGSYRIGEWHHQMRGWTKAKLPAYVHLADDGWGRLRPTMLTEWQTGAIQFINGYRCLDTAEDAFITLETVLDRYSTRLALIELFELNGIQLNERQWKLLKGVVWG